MMYYSLAVLALVPFLKLETPCGNKEFDQCGGQGFAGETCCQSYDNCSYVNDYYSQCQPKDICLNPMYGQCGGFDHHQPPRPWTKDNHHQQCCPPSFFCEYKDQYYSQCQFNASTPTKCASKYAQCGGEGWTGPTCCIPGFECTPDAKTPKYYSGCTPLPFCSNARFGQCGGIDPDQNPWTKQYGHDDCCPADFHCEYVNPYFSQCKQNTTALLPSVVEEA